MTRRNTRLAGALGALAVVALVVAPDAWAQRVATKPRLGDAEQYALIADQSIAATGDTTVEGSVAIAGTDDLSGFDPGDIEGETHLADQTALDVAGITAAVNQDLKGESCNSDRSGEDLGGLRLGEQVYCYLDPATMAGVLRLDALGDPNALFIIQMADSFTVTESSQVLLVNGAQACNVFWQVTGDVFIGNGSSMAGTFVTDGDVVFGSGASLDGRVFAPQGSIQLANATITSSACRVVTGQITTTTSSTTPPPTTPPPTTPPAAVDTDGDGIADVDEPGDANGNGVPDAQEAATTATTAPPSTGGDGGGTDPDGTGGTGLPRTGPTLVLTMIAVSLLGAGQALLRTGRIVEARRRRWRPRHAAERRRFRRDG